MAPTLNDVLPSTRELLANRLDSVIRELQVLQGVLRATQPTMPLATASTAIIGAMITTREVSEVIGMAEAQAIVEAAGV